MTLNVERDFELVILEIAGRLDTTTAPNLEAVVNELLEDTKEIVVTLSCLLTQILLYGSKLDNPTAFYKEARASEISGVLNTYFETGNLERCLTMLKVVKSDLLVMEYIAGRRDLA